MWDDVPWYTDGGAIHSEELCRLLPYLASRGNEGVAHAGDCKVTELATPGAGVQVAAGVATILNRAVGTQFQAYDGRLLAADDVDLNPTDSSGPRSDLIIVRVENPFLDGEPWADPVDPTVGPYIFSRVIENVPSTTTTVNELALGYSAIALARVDLPPSTSVVTDAMITDLRVVANPRTHRVVTNLFPSVATDATGASFATWLTMSAVDIPAWATAARIRLDLSGATATTAALSAQVRANLGAGGAVSDPIVISEAAGARFTYSLTSEQPVDAGVRGTNQTLTIEAEITSGTGVLEADASTSVSVDIEFVELAE